MVTRSELRCMHLCSGYGGFELGLRLAGVPSRTVCHIERDSYAAATLVARMAEKNLDSAPIWDDLTTFDSAAWSGKVDCITAGFPCQPFSIAGNKDGVDDERWLWPSIFRIVRNVGPRFVFLENVTGLVRGGLPFVLSDLANIGFDAEWGLFSAAEVGAPHKRERFWLLAHSKSFNERESEYEECSESWGDSRGDTGGSSQQLGDTSRERRSQVAGSTHSDEATPVRAQADSSSDFAYGPSEDVADSSGSRSERFSGATITGGQKFSDASSSGSATWPPGRDGDWARYLAEGGFEPSVRRSTNGPPEGLADSLHLGGNGLVPAVAAAAFVELYRRLMSDS